MRLHPGADLRAGQSEQGPQDAVALAHAAQAARARAAQQVEDQGLGVVVGVVRDGHGLEPLFPAEPGEPGIAQLPCGHLDADAVRGSVGPGVEALHEAVQAVRGAPVPHERLVAVGLVAAQAEVAMRDGKPGSGKEFRGPVCQVHRIDAPADGEKDPAHQALFLADGVGEAEGEELLELDALRGLSALLVGDQHDRVVDGPGVEA